MINTSLFYKEQNFVLSLYKDNLWINGRKIYLRHIGTLTDEEKEMIKALKGNKMNENLATFVVLIRQDLHYENKLLKWLMINILYTLYGKRNIVAGSCSIGLLSEKEISINGRRITFNKDKLIEEEKRIFGR